MISEDAPPNAACASAAKSNSCGSQIFDQYGHIRVNVQANCVEFLINSFLFSGMEDRQWSLSLRETTKPKAVAVMTHVYLLEIPNYFRKLA
ncbi:hypothetical protein [Desulfolutivibrio sulfoxidireducens]|uniref:hypothetical protein n=1 Tax=Desulfolutivibrio sulfoxidireducens TaxID=2773299 RepID=UPI00159DA761|nr:hypothetical protein [Desulfolutivibrio sulfoxidireducens]QLA15678.1 hypothetical protein GD605_05695 [Desulfolutivibrio sulfoxidireducens]